MIRRVDHLGIAVRELEESLQFWSRSLGLDVRGIETVETEGVKVAILPLNDSRVELLAPTSADSPVGRFLDKRGPGIHHLALEVADIDACVAELNERGVSFVGTAPRSGAEGCRVAFLHPKSTGGVLLELVERSATPAEPKKRIEPGACVLLYLRDPQEKLWGVLRRLDTAGVMIEGIDLGSFDDWVAQVERRDETVAGPSVLFLPTSRLEKILLDQSSGQLPSLAERFLQRTGRSVQDVLAESDPEGDDRVSP